MDRNLSRLRLTSLLARMFFGAVIRGTGFVEIMLLLAITSILAGLWRTSHEIAHQWEIRTGIMRIDSNLDGAPYWVARIVALAILLLCWVILSYITVWIIYYLF